MSSNGRPSCRGCNEQCLHRIAALLCRLDDYNNAANEGVSGTCATSATQMRTSAEDARPRCGSQKELVNEDDCAGKAFRSSGKFDLPTDGREWISGDTDENHASLQKEQGRDGQSAIGSTSCCSGRQRDKELESGLLFSADNCSATGAGAQPCCGDQKAGVDDAEIQPEVCCTSPEASAGCCTSISTQSTYCTTSVASKSASVPRSTSNNIASCCSAEGSRCGAGCCSYSKPTDPADRNATVARLPRARGCATDMTSSCCGEVRNADNVQEETCKKNCCEPLSAKTVAFSIDGECVDECCKVSGTAQPVSTKSACSGHLQLAMDRYEGMLKLGLCLCRRVRERLGFCCCTASPTGTAKLSPLCSARSFTELPRDKAVTVSTETETHLRCSINVPKTHEHDMPFAVRVTKKLDFEQAAAREHVVLRVAGMTCTGCSKKMMNVLGPIAGLSNAQVTFVSGSAEFDLEPLVSDNVESIILRIEKETGFKCSRVVHGRQELNIIMSAEAAKQLEEATRPGIISITKEKNKSYRVTYDPAIVGARSLLPEGAQLAPPIGHAGAVEGKRRLYKTAINTALATVLTIPVVVLEWSSNPVPHRTRSVITLVLGTCVQAIAIPEFYVGALKSLVYSRVIEMDMLVVISITAAYIYSVVAFGLTEVRIELEQEAFFETSTLLITLVLLGRLIASWARMRAVSSVSLRSLQAETTLLLYPDGQTGKIDARLLQFGDTIAIPAHSRIVTDGQVVSGTSEVNESMVTGESVPLAKHAGDNVIAGTINGPGNVSVLLSRLPGENSITDTAALVENAVASKPRVQELADRVASWFIPGVIAIAIIVFCIWAAVAIRIRDYDAGGAVGLAITYAIAVLAISCPCALGLAVPMVLVIAGGVAARAGVIIKAANALERGYQVTDVVFDKTGTLTKGDLQVVHQEMNFTSGLNPTEVLSLAMAIVESNEHPVSVAIAAHLSTTTPALTKLDLDSIVSIPGAGIEARHGGIILKAGNPHWLDVQQHPIVAPLLQEAMTFFCMTLDNELILMFGLKSTIRSNAGSVIARLSARNIPCHMVSGDNPAVVNDVALMLGIPFSRALSRISPAGKQLYVQDLQATRKKVLFCGDGTNDAVAIAQANVGMQMGSVSDITGAVADVVLLSQDLEGVHVLLDLSNAAVRRVIFNFGWSAAYNIFAILLASGAFVKFRIEPAYAGLGEIVSVLPVIMAAGTLLLGWRS